MDWEHVVTGRVNTINRDIAESIPPIRPKHVPQIEKTLRPLWLVNFPFWNHPSFLLSNSRFIIFDLLSILNHFLRFHFCACIMLILFI
ncbi:hypothetical protein Hanom_Chr12g01164301 [Helianthus anomalus]